MSVEQHEKAFQKRYNLTKSKVAKGGKGAGKPYFKDIGKVVGNFKPPTAALNNTKFVDKKCPFTGQVSIQGRILIGEVVSAKMKNTIVVRRNYLHYIPKYNRYEKRRKNIAAHVSPAFDLSGTPIKKGDQVTIGQCRPLSKTVRFNVLKINTSAKASKTFTE